MIFSVVIHLLSNASGHKLKFSSLDSIVSDKKSDNSLIDETSPVSLVYPVDYQFLSRHLFASSSLVFKLRIDRERRDSLQFEHSFSSLTDEKE